MVRYKLKPMQEDIYRVEDQSSIEIPDIYRRLSAFHAYKDVIWYLPYAGLCRVRGRLSLHSGKAVPVIPSGTLFLND